MDLEVEIKDEWPNRCSLGAGLLQGMAHDQAGLADMIIQHWG